MEWLAKLVHWLIAKRDKTITPPPEPTVDTSETVLVDAPAIIRAREWKPFSGPLDRLPRNRKEVYEIFGNPGSGTVDKKWKKENIRTYRDLPGIPRKWYFQFHKLAEPNLREGLRRAQIAAPDYVITRAGGFVFRHIRHDSSRPLSKHSWGIAIDNNPKQNSAKYFRPRGTAPEMWGEEWLKIWPEGVTQAWVEAMQSAGFVWGGNWDGDETSTDHTFIDNMHCEICG
jgi:hypothetical protein